MYAVYRTTKSGVEVYVAPSISVPSEGRSYQFRPFGRRYFADGTVTTEDGRVIKDESCRFVRKVKWEYV